MCEKRSDHSSEKSQRKREQSMQQRMKTIGRGPCLTRKETAKELLVVVLWALEEWKNNAKTNRNILLKNQND